MGLVVASIVAYGVIIALLAAIHTPLWASFVVAVTLPIVAGGGALLLWLRGVSRQPRGLREQGDDEHVRRATIAPRVVTGLLVLVQLAFFASSLPAIVSGHASQAAWHIVVQAVALIAFILWMELRSNKAPDPAAAARVAERMRLVVAARSLPPGRAREQARAAVRRDFAYKGGVCAVGIIATLALGPTLGWISAIVVSFGPLIVIATVAEGRLSRKR